MRQIKFRGKILSSDKWVEGDLLQNNGHPIIIAQVNRDYISRTSVGEGNHWSIETPAYFVDPTTVGQFTGFLDKNGKDIYEGDVVSDGVNNGFVFYNDDSAQYQVNFSPIEDCPQEMMKNNNWAEVIGNIHDNPSLLTNK